MIRSQPSRASAASIPNGAAPNWKKTATANDTTIAVTSLHTLIRHQNQRRI